MEKEYEKTKEESKFVEYMNESRKFMDSNSAMAAMESLNFIKFKIYPFKE